MKQMTSTQQEFERLAGMTMPQLREAYAELFGEATRSGNWRWLFRRCAWRVQALAEGGLPKTHIVEGLLSLLQPAVPDAVSGLADAAALTPYAVGTRYPGDQPEPTPEEARQAMELARTVRKAVLPLLPSVPTGD